MITAMLKGKHNCTYKQYIKSTTILSLRGSQALQIQRRESDIEEIHTRVEVRYYCTSRGVKLKAPMQ